MTSQAALNSMLASYASNGGNQEQSLGDYARALQLQRASQQSMVNPGQALAIGFQNPTAQKAGLENTYGAGNVRQDQEGRWEINDPKLGIWRPAVTKGMDLSHIASMAGKSGVYGLNFIPKAAEEVAGVVGAPESGGASLLASSALSGAQQGGLEAGRQEIGNLVNKLTGIKGQGASMGNVDAGEVARETAAGATIPGMNKVLGFAGKAIGKIMPTDAIAKDVQNVVKSSVDKYTKQDALTRAIPEIPDHVSSEVLDAAKKKIDFLPPSHADTGSLFAQADKSTGEAFDSIEKDMGKKFSAGLANVKGKFLNNTTGKLEKGVTDATVLDKEPLVNEINKVLYDYSQNYPGATAPSRLQGILNTYAKSTKNGALKLNDTPLTYGDLKALKGELYKLGTKAQDPGIQSALLDAHSALKKVEEEGVPGLKEIKAKFGEGSKVLDAIESLNKGWSQEEKLGANTLQGGSKISRLGNEKSGVTRFNILKQVNEYMNKEGIKNNTFWRDINRALLKDSFVKHAEKAAAKPFNPINPLDYLGKAKDVLIGGPERQLRTLAFGTRTGILPESYLNSNASKILGGKFGKFGHLAAAMPSPAGLASAGLNIAPHTPLPRAIAGKFMKGFEPIQDKFAKDKIDIPSIMQKLNQNKMNLTAMTTINT